jgi:hypothetical protein
MPQNQRRALQAAEKLERRPVLCQGTTLVVPQMPQNQRRALQAAEKLERRPVLCQGTTLVVPQCHKINVGL